MNEKYKFTIDKLVSIKEIINNIEENNYIDGYLGYEDDFYIDSILYYLKENERLKENNMSMQEEMARTWEKADLYKEVIEEVRDRITIKLGRYINEKDYVIDDVALDELLQILDKVKD